MLKIGQYFVKLLTSEQNTHFFGPPCTWYIHPLLVYLYTVSDSGLLLTCLVTPLHYTENVFLPVTFSYPWPWTLTNDLDLRIWPRQSQEESPCQMSIEWKVIFIESYRPNTQTHTHAHQTIYCWQPCLSGCCSLSLEQPAKGRHLIVITAVFPASTKDSSFSTIVSTPDSLTAYQASLQWSL